MAGTNYKNEARRLLESLRIEVGDPVLWGQWLHFLKPNLDAGNLKGIFLVLESIKRTFVRGSSPLKRKVIPILDRYIGKFTDLTLQEAVDRGDYDMDWRPNETIPEDYYMRSLPVERIMHIKSLRMKYRRK